MTRPLYARSYLYVPGDRPELISKAMRSDADVVVLDLEDGIAAAAKEQARHTVCEVLAAGTTKPVLVRVNRPGSATGNADLEAILDARPNGVRLPKCESPELVADVAARLAGNEDPVPVFCLIESALGLERAYELATAAPTVAGLLLGEADLSGDLGTRSEAALLYARSRCVVASRAAGLPAPVQSVFPRLRAVEALTASCRAGRELGFFGRSAIHPEQLRPINQVFTPSAEELAHAREVVAKQDECSGGVLTNGSYVDEGVAFSARALLALADSLGLEVPK